VDDADIMVERGLGNQEIGDRDAVPHPVVVSKVVLEPQLTVEKIRRGISGQKVVAQQASPSDIVACRPDRIEQLELAYRADVEDPGELGQLPPHDGVVSPRLGALVDDPASYRDISSDASTSRSTCSGSDLK
jgi:hypothetical protein